MIVPRGEDLRTDPNGSFAPDHSVTSLRDRPEAVPPAGFEPAISCVKGRRPRPLDHGGKELAASFYAGPRAAGVTVTHEPFKLRDPGSIPGRPMVVVGRQKIAPYFYPAATATASISTSIRG